MSPAVLLNHLVHLSRAGLGAPVLVMMMLVMVVIPLPPFLLDVLFTFNISLALIVLLAAIYSQRPLEFAVFPIVLLVATLLRLALNVASTRVVLLEGHTGTQAAGRVIEAFGAFVIGGSYAVGLVVFAILVIINFVVVTKGAGRISEVSARFTLDAMPGKQMAIDADLNAGVLTQDEARARREEVAREADFYGAMDGASKFVRGDAIAGILILVINLVGGLIIGTAQHGLSFGDAIRFYALLTIGDGLVAQIPSLLLSSAAAIMVTRVSSAHDMGTQILDELFQNPRTLAVTAGVIGFLGVLPGMPNVVFLSLAGLAGGGAWLMHRSRRRAAEAEAGPAPAEASPAEQDLGWDDVQPFDPLGLEIGYRLIPLVDKGQGGQLMDRVRAVRRKFTKELGFLIPPVHIRDNLELAPAAYTLSALGVTVGEAAVEPERVLAINPGHVSGELQGTPARDPVFGFEAVWIDSTQRDAAQAFGYTVADATTVIATHLDQVLNEHAYRLLGHQEVQQVLDRLAERAPKLVESLVPDRLPLGTVVKVMQNLLREGVPIRDVRTIVETLAEQAAQSQDPDALTSAVRVALGRFIVQEINGLEAELPVITLDPALDQLLHQSLQTVAPAGSGFEPGTFERLQGALSEAVNRQETLGEPAVLLVSDRLRPLLGRLARQGSSALKVLAYGEVPEGKAIKIVASVGGEEPLAAAS